MSLGRGSEQGGARLSVIELRGICPLLLILLVILHAFESLAGEVFKHNVIIICIEFYQICIYGHFILWNVPVYWFLPGFGMHQREGQLHCNVTGGEVSQQASS